MFKPIELIFKIKSLMKFQTTIVKLNFYTVLFLIVFNFSGFLNPIFAQAPIVQFSAIDSSFCIRDSIVVQFLDQSSNSPTQWVWSFPGGNPSASTLQNPIVTYYQSGDYTVSLTALNDSGSHFLRKDNFIKIHVPPNPKVIPSGNLVLCQDTIFLNAGSGYSKYQWNNGDSTQITKIFSEGTYQVLVDSAFGCQSISEIVRIRKGEIPQANFQVDRACFNQIIHFQNNTSFPLGNSVFYSWKFGNSDSSFLENPSKIFLNQNSIDVELISKIENNCSDTILKNIKINSNPFIEIFEDKIIKQGEQIQIQVQADPNLNYNWNPSLGLDNATIQNPIANPIQTTLYELTATNSDSCTTKDSILISIFEEFELEPYNLITPNGDGKNDTWIIPNLESFPNNEVLIFNRWGKIVYQQKNYNNDWSGDNLPDGTYYYILKIPNFKKNIEGDLTILR